MLISFVMATVQIRDVPDEALAVLKRRASASGVSLSQYLREMLSRMASRPTIDELQAEIQREPPVTLSEPVEKTVRDIRDHGE
jgi:plasmid stability protein